MWYGESELSRRRQERRNGKDRSLIVANAFVFVGMKFPEQARQTDEKAADRSQTGNKDQKRAQDRPRREGDHSARPPVATQLQPSRSGDV